MSDTLRTAIIGAGAITQVAHLPVLRKLKGVELCAVCDTDLPKARSIADRFGIKDAFDDIEEVLATRARRDRHLHAQPPPRGPRPRGAERRLHVLVESPAVNTASAQRIFRAAEKGPRRDGGMNHRYRADVQLSELVQTGELGEVESVRGAGTSSGRAAPCSGGGPSATSPAGARCSTSGSPFSISLSG
jgi:predicted dehydrogenase